MSKIRIGVFGAGRGMDIARNFMLLGCEIVAICDNHVERREKAAKTLDSSVAVYDDFDKFIEHDMDAVVLANYAHQHAPFAIRCMEAGKHVLCEKPLAINAEEGRRMIDKARTKGLLLMEAMISTLNPNFIMASSKLAEIAPIRHYSSYFCQYSSICQFDSTMKDNDYRIINKKDQDEIINKMRGEIE